MTTELNWTSDVNRLNLGTATSTASQSNYWYWYIVSSLAGTGAFSSGLWSPVSSCNGGGTAATNLGDFIYITVGSVTQIVRLWTASSPTSITAANFAAAINNCGFGASAAATVSGSQVAIATTGAGFTIGGNAQTLTNIGISAGTYTTTQTTSVSGGFPLTIKVDTWSLSSFASATFTHNTAGNNHSWYCLRSPSGMTTASTANPSGYVYLVLDLNSATAQSFTITYSIQPPTAPASGTLFNTAPISIAGSNDSVSTGLLSSIDNNNNSIAHYAHMSLASRGDWWFLNSYSGSASFYSGLGCTALQNSHAADQYGFVSLAGTNIPNASTWYLAYAVAGYWSTSSLAGQANTQMKARSWNGTVASVAVIPAYTFANGSGAPYSAITANGGGALAGPVVPGTNPSDGTYNQLPCFVVLSSSNAQELKGRLADVWQVSSSIPQAGVLSNVTPYFAAKIGDLAVPWISVSTPSV
jgi:hypothetical protein